MAEPVRQTCYHCGGTRRVSAAGGVCDGTEPCPYCITEPTTTDKPGLPAGPPKRKNRQTRRSGEKPILRTPKDWMDWRAGQWVKSLGAAKTNLQAVYDSYQFSSHVGGDTFSAFVTAMAQVDLVLEALQLVAQGGSVAAIHARFEAKYEADIRELHRKRLERESGAKGDAV